MRKIALTIAGAAAALGLAAPAAAQYYPAYARPVYGYPTPAIASSMQARIANIRARIRGLQARGLIRWNQARNLDRQAFYLQQSVQRTAWHGMSPGESYSLNVRIANLERRVATSGYRRGYRSRYAGYRW